MFKKACFLISFLALSLSVKAVEASISYATFKGPEQNYIEVYLFIIGETLHYLPTEADSSLKKAAVDVTILFKQGEELIKFDKFRLSSPLSKVPENFVDMKRYPLPNGDYTFVVQVQDAQDVDNNKEYKAPISMQYDNSSIQQSDLQLLASLKKADSDNRFVKNGVFMEPLPFNFYGKKESHLSFYAEIYNTDQFMEEDLLVSYFVEKLENGQLKTKMIGHKRKKPKPIIPVLLQMDITELPTGNYNLVVEVRNKNKELKTKKALFFQRSNPFLEEESIELARLNIQEEFVHRLTEKELEYSLRALTAKLPQNDIGLVDSYLKEKNLEGQRLYLFSYWIQKNPNRPEDAYLEYMEVVRAIDNQFKSGFRFGFETDRGHIYLKYGQPNDITHVEEEPSAPPYEVWSYNTFPATGQSNVKFLFYNPSLAPGDFVLLHSNARGELSNPQWQRELYRDAPNEIDGNYFEGTEMQDNFNRNARRTFDDF